MKKLLLFLCILTGINGFGQISVRTQTTPTQLTAGNGTVVVKSGTTNVNVTSTVSLLPTLLTNTTTAIKKGIDTTNQTLRRLDLLERYANGKLDSIKGHLFNTATGESAANILRSSYVSQYAAENHLSNIYFNGVIGVSTYEARINRKLDSLINYTRYNNNKQDSMLTSTQSTELTFTINSTNTGTAVTNTQALGVGAYSVTIPTGRWVIESIYCIFKLQSASTQLRMFVMQGESNVSEVAEEAIYNLASANALEVSQVYVSNTTNYTSMIWNGATGAVSHFNSFNQPSIFSEKYIYTSGTLKLFLTYNASITPANTNSYYFRIYLRRVS